MSRETYVYDHATGELVMKHLRPSLVIARSDLPRPMIRSDIIIGGVSQVSGKYHDTMSGLKRDYADYEARTGQKIEIVGDQTHYLKPEFDVSQTMADEKAIDATIKQTLENLGA